MDPTIFAIDTAGERCTLALAVGTRLETVEGETSRTHLEHVMPMVAAFFARCGVAPADCDAFAFASGPGSFTGLRIACTVAQGLALAAARPVIPVGNLHAVAISAVEVLQKRSDQAPMPRAALARGQRLRVLAAVDARMRQAYWAVFDLRPGSWSEATPAALCDVNELPLLLEEWTPDLCAGNSSWLEPNLAGWRGPVIDAHAGAAVIARIAAGKFALSQTVAAQDAAPSYIRDRVAQTVAERREAWAARGV